MQTLRRIPAYALRPFPVWPSPPSPRVAGSSATQIALTIVGVGVALGASVVMAIAGAASVVFGDIDLNALSTPAVTFAAPRAPSASDVRVEHDGDDCAAAALRASHRCEDIGCFTSASVELRACLGQPEQEARLCAEMPDSFNARASAQWIDARCSFEDTRDYSDCVRLISIVNDHCADVGAAPKP